MKKTIIFGLIFLMLVSSALADDKADVLDVIGTYYSASASEDFNLYYSVISEEGYSSTKLEEKKANTKIIWQNYDTLSYALSDIIINVQDDIATAEYDIEATISHISGESTSYKSKMTAILFDEGNWKVWAVMSKANFDLKMHMYSFNLDETCLEDCDIEDEEPGFFAKIKNFFSGLVNKVIRGGTCGNKVCDSGETSETCERDCPKIVQETVVKVESNCGNYICEADETFASCVQDCKEPELIVSTPGDNKQKQENQEEQKQEQQTQEDKPLEPVQNLENKTLDVVCGDSVCQETENCESCMEDCGCVDAEVCFNRKCYLPKCFENTDCDDSRDSTKDVCEYPGKAFAKCEHSTIKRCKDDDGYCPDDCTEDNDNDCGDGDDSASASVDGWTTGSDTLSVGEDHDFFDFSVGDNTADFNDGDIFFNSFGDIMGECIDQGATCAEIKEETSDSFDEMTDAPSSGYEGYAEGIEDGKKYWVKTLEGDYAKLEITDLDTSGDDITSVSFKWGYEE
ncbi:MAG: hypothetical protein U9R08_05690 [Nanoarchaeota archaeon]|nr:hypothetical protein [Nanoarchaeota archaeon]